MSKNKSSRNPHLQQAARLREQQGKQAMKDGDTARAHEQFSKAAADYIGAGDLEGSVRCLAKSGELAESVVQLLKVFGAQDVVAEFKKNFKDSLELGLCLLAAAASMHDYKRFSAKSMLQKVAKSLSTVEALQALKGSALAADWENEKTFLKELCPALRLKLQEIQASDDKLKKKLLVEEICVISGQVFLSGDFTLLTDIDQKQMH